MRGGIEALKATVAPGQAPVKSEAPPRVAPPLLEAPVADRHNRTIARLRAEIETREGVGISRAQLSKILRKKFRWQRPRHTLRGPERRRVERVGLRLRLHKQQAEAGDNGPIHAGRLSRAALAARAPWLTVEWLRKYAPELNDIERVWHDLKANHLAQQTFADPEALDAAIHHGVLALNQQQTCVPLDKIRIST